MRSVVVAGLLFLLLAGSTSAVRFDGAAVVSLPEAPDLLLPDADAGTLLASAGVELPELRPTAAAPGPGLRLPAPPSSRGYVVIDAERRFSPPPTEPLPASTESGVPMFVKVGTVSFDARDEAPRLLAEEPVRSPPRDLASATARLVAPAAGAVGLAVVAVASLASGLFVHGAVAMYHRIAPSQALANATRARVHGEVVLRGYATASEVAAALGLHPKTVAYHLDLLAGFQLLVRDADGAFRAPGTKRTTEPTLEETIFELVRDRPGINMTEVAREVGVSKSTAQERVTRLLVEGRIESRRDERARLLYPAAPVAAG